MKKHKLKHIYHCEDCFDKGIKKVGEVAHNQRSFFLVSSKQYPFVEKYGLGLGLMKYFEEVNK